MVCPTFRTSTKERKIEVCDKNGNKEILSSVNEVCELLKCTRSYVYQGLRNGKEIVGCKVRFVDNG